MIDINNFANENLDKKVAYDAADNGQCTAIVNLWLVANNLPPIICNAINFKDVNNSAYEFIANTPENQPSVGDIVIFNIGQYGHVSIALKDINVDNFTSLDQNWPEGSPVSEINHNYTNPQVLGWVHPKAFTPEFPKNVTISVDELNVRTEANVDSQIVMTLKEGSTVTVESAQDGSNYVINGINSNQWYKTYAGHFIAVEGTK